MSQQHNGLYNQFEWIVTLINMGIQPVDFDLVAIEDPLTGEISCSQEGLEIENCSAKSVKGSNQLFIRVLYTSDFMISSLRKNLIMRTAGWVQRFPIVLEIDEQAIIIANRFSNFSPVTLWFGSGEAFSEKIPGLRIMMAFIAALLFALMRRAISYSLRLPSFVFAEFGIKQPIVTNEPTAA